MKSLRLALSLFFLTPALLFAQPNPDHHRHDGFFLSISPGVAGGGAVFSEDLGSAEEVTFSGPGGMLDFKIGGAVAENFILSFDIIGRNIRGPDIKTENGTFETDEDIILNDGTVGLGMTYYFGPSNVFFSGTLGLGRLTLYNAPFDDRIDSEAGLSLHAKIGKEWWVGPNWGLGIAGGYGFVGAKDPADNGADYQGDYASHKLYVLFNTTFN
jgi:hypothetical protein